MNDQDWYNYYKNEFADSLSVSQLTTANQGLQLATVEGKTDFAQIFGFILKYGGEALTVLTKTGVIKDQNRLAIAEINSGAMAQLLAANGGTLDKSPKDVVEPRNANLIGIESNTILLVGGAILATWLLTSKK